MNKLPTAYCLAAYLYGSLPLVYLLGRRHNVDLTEVGSGNVGGSNLWVTAGAAPGALGWIGDASKGLLPVAVGRRLGLDEEVCRLAGVCGTAGQCWPAFLRFNGGRGISAFVGAAFAIDRTGWAMALVPLIGGSLWRVLSRQKAEGRRQKEDSLPTAYSLLPTRRSKSVPFACLVSVLIFPVACAVGAQRGRGLGAEHGGVVRGGGVWSAALAPALLTLVILVRRLSAPLPDDATCGPAVHRRALVFRLLFDRNTSD